MLAAVGVAQQQALELRVGAVQQDGHMLGQGPHVAQHAHLGHVLQTALVLRAGDHHRKLVLAQGLQFHGIQRVACQALKQRLQLGLFGLG